MHVQTEGTQPPRSSHTFPATVCLSDLNSAQHKVTLMKRVKWNVRESKWLLQKNKSVNPEIVAFNADTQQEVGDTVPIYTSTWTYVWFCVQKHLVKITLHWKQLMPLCSTEACRWGGGSCRGEKKEEGRWRAVPFAAWNEWYGAVVTIHACSFTSLSHVHALSQSSHCSLFEIFSLVKQELPGKGRSGQRIRKQLRRRRRWRVKQKERRYKTD